MIWPSIALGLLLFASPTWAEQQPEPRSYLGSGPAYDEVAPMQLGEIVLEIGMEEEELLGQLRNDFLIEPVRENTWSVWDKEESDQLHGIVQFRKGRLNWASRDLGVFEGEEVRKFAQVLFKAIVELTDADPDDITVTASISGGENVTKDEYLVSSLTLGFSGRELTVHVSHTGDMVDASIEEVLKPALEDGGLTSQ